MSMTQTGKHRRVENINFEWIFPKFSINIIRKIGKGYILEEVELCLRGRE
jgi:hypothetical protein